MLPPYYQEPNIAIYNGNSLDVSKEMEPESIQMVVTSPPYWGLRDYGIDGQLGLEKTPEEYVAKLTDIFREIRRVLKKDGVCFLNLGDSYAGGGRGGKEQCGKGSFEESRYENGMKIGLPTGKINGFKPKDLIGIPWRVALSLQADGWWLRQDIIWNKPNPMPESVTDRCTKSHEYIFLLTKSAKYFWDQEAVKEDQKECTTERYKYSWNGINDDGSGGARTGSAFKKMKQGMSMGEAMGGEGKRNIRSVWTITTQPTRESHFATFPEKLVETCIKAGSRIGDTILDPFAGIATALRVARRMNRKGVGIELNPKYIDMSIKYFNQEVLSFKTTEK